jgi:excisionase family DNA binding protein
MPKPVSATETDLLTTDQVIQRLLDANLRRVAATCVLPAVRSGDHWRFRRADLDEWIRRQASPSAPGPGDKRPS